MAVLEQREYTINNHGEILQYMQHRGLPVGSEWCFHSVSSDSASYLMQGSIQFYGTFLSECQGFFYINYKSPYAPRVLFRMSYNQLKMIENQYSNWEVRTSSYDNYQIYQNRSHNIYDVYCTENFYQSMKHFDAWLGALSMRLYGLSLDLCEVDVTLDRQVTLVHRASGESIKLKLETREFDILDSPDLIVWLDQKMEEGCSWATEIAEKISA